MKIKGLLIVALAFCIFTNISVLASNKDSVFEKEASPEKNADSSKNKIVPIIDTTMGSILGGAMVTPTSFYLVGAKETYDYIKNKTGRIRLTPFAPVANYQSKRRIIRFTKAPPNCENFYGVRLDRPVKGILIGTESSWQPDYPQAKNLWKKRPGRYWQNRVYKKATADFLRSKGIANPKVQIVEAKRIDFDGDGTDEVIINASYIRDRTNPFKLNRGDYHMVFVRKIVNGKVKNILIEGQFGNGRDVGAIFEHDIYAILDLEGDGKKEIILHTRVPEGRWSKVFHMEGNGFVEVLRTGCSA